MTISPYTPPPPEAEAVQEGIRLGEVIQEALATLPPGQLGVFSRVVLEGANHQEVATELGISRSSVRQQLWRARRQMRAFLEARHIRSSDEG